MSEREPGKHVPVDTLAAFLEGRLSEEEENEVRAHLAGCASCDLELRHLERFASVDADEDLARRAEWIYARGKLERAYKERIAPAVAIPPGGAKRRLLRFRRPLALVPIAAAAIALIAVLRFTAGEPRMPSPDRDVMRSAPPAPYGITLRSPSGDVQGFPETFSWEAERENEVYALEIFAPSLERVYRVEGLKKTEFASPDTLRSLLRPNIIYLWNVKGRRGLGRASLSPNGWFRYKP